jgi:NAD(P)-dependent dehydrogenase (short-subunit alcohol dehydrogenase family)
MGVLDGKVVVVSGAGQGIGREEALACARAGAAVVVDDLAGADATAAAVNAEGGRALALAHDVGDFEGAGRLVADAVEAFGGLDGVGLELPVPVGDAAEIIVGIALAIILGIGALWASATRSSTASCARGAA